jgi:predicted nucleotidyltransferase
MRGETTENTLDQAKAIITEELEKAGFKVLRILLFGSRARGDARSDSDWDFFVVVDRECGFREMQDIISRISWRLATIEIYADVIVESQKTVEQRKNNTGFLTYYVLKEGIAI